MKKILPVFLLLAVTAFFSARCQSDDQTLPASTLIRHYHLAVSYNTTTVLVFPALVKAVDRGNRDLMAQRQSATENVLLLKAAHRNIQPTNLHVFTADGRIFAFDIIYGDSLATTHDLSHPQLSEFSAAPAIRLSGQPVNSDEMTGFVSQARNQSAEFSTNVRAFRMRLRLDNIDMAGSYLFFRFSITNHSRLDYTPDFLRLYIRDQSQVRRSSSQEQEIIPVFSDSLVAIPGKAIRSIVLAIPKMTISNHKEFRIELFEKNGGRSLSLQIKNRQLFRARELAAPTDNHGNR